MNFHSIFSKCRLHINSKLCSKNPQILKVLRTEPEMSFWQNFRQRLHWELSTGALSDGNFTRMIFPFQCWVLDPWSAFIHCIPQYSVHMGMCISIPHTVLWGVGICIYPVKAFMRNSPTVTQYHSCASIIQVNNEVNMVVTAALVPVWYHGICNHHVGESLSAHVTSVST